MRPTGERGGAGPPASPEAPASTAGVIAPPPLIYLAGLLLGAALHWWRPVGLVPPGLALPLGVAGLSLGFVAIPALLAFHRAGTRPEPWKPTRALVTSGPYRHSRNPMYLGFTMGYLGTAFWCNSIWMLVMVVPVLWVMQVGVVRREEAYLARRFGEDYRAYQRRVRRWI